MKSNSIARFSKYFGVGSHVNEDWSSYSWDLGKKKIQLESKYPQIRKCTLLNGRVSVRTFETAGKKGDIEGTQSELTNQANIKVNNSRGKNNIYHHQRWKTLSQQSPWPKCSINAHAEAGRHCCYHPKDAPGLCSLAQKRRGSWTHSSLYFVPVRTISLEAIHVSQPKVNATLNIDPTTSNQRIVL